VQADGQSAHDEADSAADSYDFEAAILRVRTSRERAAAVGLVIAGLGQLGLAVLGARRGDRGGEVFFVVLAVLTLSLGVRHVVRYWVRAGTGALARRRRAGRLDTEQPNSAERCGAPLSCAR
jgi:hypothetical protein